MNIRTLHMSKKRVRSLVVLAALMSVPLTFVALYLVGCTDTLDGDSYENQKPVVYFATIPPEGDRFSRNETIYWYGTDPDGLIDYYRYHTVEVYSMGGKVPMDYIVTVPDEDWVIVDVDPAAADPNTDGIIPLSADLDDPVNRYVSQWIFLQAFDLEGLGSDIAIRLFSRNDHPPETKITPFAARLPFVNSVDSGGIVTGVWLSWSGTDRLDYPEGDWPPFEFEWRLYGPYSDSGFTDLVDSFVRPVLVTVDGKVYDAGVEVEHCDTTFGESVIISCTTVVVSATTDVTWGDIEWKFYIDDASFINNPAYDKLVDCSCDDYPPPEDPTEDCLDTWVLNRSNVSYDVYKHAQFDTTVEMWYMFWIRGRDDAYVADLVPAFDSFTVIDPRQEREVVVIDFLGDPSKKINFPLAPVRMGFWKDAIERWKPGITFDTSGMAMSRGLAPDYLDAPMYGKVPLSLLLKHKVIVLYDDNVEAQPFADENYTRNIYTAIDAGVNVWATWRAPLPVREFEMDVPAAYQYYFGVRSMAFSAWYCHAMASQVPDSPCDSARIEDFMGAYAIDSVEWPNVAIDTTLLQTRYQWAPPFPPYSFLVQYKSEHPGLPEVNWAVRSPATDVLYLYKSFYGPDHPMGGMFNMEGNPVAHRLGTALFRTVHFNFTLLAIDSVQAQQVVNNVLDWLYPTNISTTAKVRYPDAPVRISVSEARARYEQRLEQYARYLEMHGDQGGAGR